MEHGRSGYIADRTYSAPYYRIVLHRRANNRQHHRLKLLARRKPQTYYVAPEINCLEDFNTAFFSNAIVSNSRLIPIADCRDIVDSEQHYISYQKGNTQWIEHSEPKYHQKSILGGVLPESYRSNRGQWRSINKEFAGALFNETRDLAMEILSDEDIPHTEETFEFMNFRPERAKRHEILLRTADILSVFFGVSLVLVGDRE